MHVALAHRWLVFAQECCTAAERWQDRAYDRLVEVEGRLP
jgi:hypothetical protein